MLRQRIITALILAVLVIAAILLLPNNWLAVLFAIVTLVGAWEWTNLLNASDSTRKLLYMVFVAASLLVTCLYASPEQTGVILLVAGLWWAAVVIFLAIFDVAWLGKLWLHRVLEFSGFVVLVPSYYAIVTLHRIDPKMLLYLLFLVAIADIAAYFTGKKFGKNKLAPTLSPGKSREGLFGALAASLVIAVIGMIYFKFEKNLWLYFVGLCVLTALISVVGDLFESLLKRHAGVKDSSNLLPGHGGILDRIDSLTAAAPGFVLGLYWVA